MSGESSKKKKKQTKSPQSPAISSDVVEESAADQEFYKKVSTMFESQWNLLFGAAFHESTGELSLRMTGKVMRTVRLIDGKNNVLKTNSTDLQGVSQK